MALTIVMYHYVRRLSESRYPEIKGLERDHFREQIRYLRRFYTPVSGHEVIKAIQGQEQLPQNAVLLTFDDGYLDHFTTVFPILRQEQMSGAFFPPARSVQDGVILDVNKIHYLLASVADKSKLVSAIDNAVLEAKGEFDLSDLTEYHHQYAVANRFDPAEVIYIKRMLQVGLPEQLRNQITDRLFSKFVASDQRAFAREIYMDEDQIRCLVDAGMLVGSHGYNHAWLNHLSPEDQAEEIDLSLAFLRRVGVETTDWVMCYPYGGWSDSLLEILRARNCAVAFTTEVDIADLNQRDPLLLPRLDTNDLPKAANADASPWTLRITAA